MLKVFGVRLWVAVCVVIGLALTLGCYFPWRLESQIAADPGVASGRIDGSMLERNPKGAPNWLVTYSFEVDGRRYSRQVAVSSETGPERVRPGREIAVRYCSYNPELNQPDIVVPRLTALRLELAVGVICLLGGIVLAIGDLSGHSMLVFSDRRSTRVGDKDLPGTPPPRGCTVLVDNDQKLVISHRWLCGRTWLRVVFALFFPILLSYQIWLRSQCPAPTAMSRLFDVMAILAILACLAYVAIIISGRTIITATPVGVEVVSRPFALLSFTIKRRVLERFISRPRMGAVGNGGGIAIGEPASLHLSGWHEVEAVCNLAAGKIIAGNCSSEHQSRWLAARLNSFFGIRSS